MVADTARPAPFAAGPAGGGSVEIQPLFTSASRSAGEGPRQAVRNSAIR